MERPVESDTHPAVLSGYRPFLFIIILGLLIYGWTVFFEFSFCDDYKNIVEEHETISSFSKIPAAFVKSFGNFYRPVLRISYIIDARFGGTSPWIYHLSNVLYHLMASCLVFMTLLALWESRRTALLFALLFTAHPLLVVAVAWIPGRNDSLVTIFVLMSFLGLIRANENKSPIWYAGHVAAFALALFTKEIALFFPLAASLYLFGVKKEKIMSQRSLVLFVGWGMVIVPWFFLRKAALAGVSSPDTVGLEALIKNWPVLFAMLGKVILPWKLSGLATLDSLSIISGTVLLAILPFLLVLTRGINYRTVLFGASWYLVFFIPTLFYRIEHGDDHFDYMEHRAYLPMIGALVVLIEVLSRRGIRFDRKVVLPVFAVIVAAFGARGVVYSLEFHDRHTFWEKAIAHDPTRSNFYSVMGKLHFDKGELDRAAKCFERAIELSRCNDAKNCYSLAGIYREMGRREDAIALYGKAVELDPENPLFRYRLAKTYYENRQMEPAESHIRKALALQPDDTDMLILLVGIHAGGGRIDKAIETCHAILAVDARHFHACNILGDLYSKQGAMDDAAAMWEKIIRIKPDHLASYQNLLAFHLAREAYREARYYALEIQRRGGTLSPEVIKTLNDHK